MTAVNQPAATPVSTWHDHSDAMSQRDSGWVQLHAQTCQEAADLHIQAFRIAEELSVPVMVCVDGALLAEATAPAGTASQEQVDAFVPPRRAPHAAGPVSPGVADSPGAFTEVRYLTHARQLRALGLIPGVADEFRLAFGRESGGLVPPYRMEGARTIVVGLGSALGAIKEAADGLRSRGVRIGVLGITSYRPFPLRAVRQHLAGARHLVVAHSPPASVASWPAPYPPHCGTSRYRCRPSSPAWVAAPSPRPPCGRRWPMRTGAGLRRSPSSASTRPWWIGNCTAATPRRARCPAPSAGHQTRGSAWPASSRGTPEPGLTRSGTLATSLARRGAGRVGVPVRGSGTGLQEEQGWLISGGWKR
jgi:hypothetical protein